MFFDQTKANEPDFFLHVVATRSFGEARFISKQAFKPVSYFKRNEHQSCSLQLVNGKCEKSKFSRHRIDITILGPDRSIHPSFQLPVKARSKPGQSRG